MALRLVSFRCTNSPAISRLGALSHCTKEVIDLSDPHFRTLTGLSESSTMIDIIISRETTSLIKHAISHSVPASSRRSFKDIFLNPPISPHRNLICIGKNYADHVAEINKVGSSGGDGSIPKYPVYFTKAPTTVIAHNETIESHSGLTKWLDYEAELAVVVGKKGRDISIDDVGEHIFGYTIANDVTARGMYLPHKYLRVQFKV